MLASAQVTFLPDGVVPSRGQLLLYQASEADPQALEALAADLGLEGGQRQQPRLYVPDAEGVPRLAPVSALTSPVTQAVSWLLGLRQDAGRASPRHSDSLRVWALTARVAWRLVVGHHIVPSLALDDDLGVHGVWRVVPSVDPDAASLLERLAAALPPAGHAVPRDEGRVWRADELLAAFCDAVADLAAREGTEAPRQGRPRGRVLPWTARWHEALRDREDSSVPLRENGQDLVASVAEWHRSLSDDGSRGLTELELVAPDDAQSSWWLRLGVRAETGALRSAAQVWAEGSGDADGADLQETLLAGLGRCARVFPPLEAALSEAVPEAVELDTAQAWTFVSEAAPVLDGAGVVVRLPQDLEQGALRVRLRVGTEPEDTAEEEVGYSWEVALGEEILSEEEVEQLYALDEPLLRWRDRWVRLEPDDAARLRALGEPGSLPLVDALGLALAGTQPADWEGTTAAEVDAEVVADGRIASLLERLRGAADLPLVSPTPEGFVGELRPYQQRGVSWLTGMGRTGFGAVLADDMGLGKTIQLIGYLLARGEGPHLVVCPTSVVGNWERELARFAPGLPTVRHHGPERASHIDEPTGVYLTTYGTLRRDVEALADVAWDVVSLDEAQHVKNPATAGARAVRRLQANHRVAMTGTPLENRLAELWSLMDATNPGLLGSRLLFGRRFVTPIEKRREPGAAQRLRRLVAPFILRREKTDPKVISDLPDKIERTVVCPLTPEQAKLYEAAVEGALGGDALAEATAMERRGRILALLTRLKQICNHPAQVSDEPRPVLAGRSGKLSACRELVADAVDGGEQVLIFSQYVTMGRLLARQLSEDLDVAVPLLHGGVAPGARDDMVARFQGEADEAASPVLVVSLRAGGTGLNLTAATHVIHYDRWWNPAVEDQATDRAHRIGQARTVEVHKLVTAGTVEERVADMLERKRALAASVVGAGEAWVTELGNDEIAELVALGADATIEDLDEEGWDASDPLEEVG